MVKPHFKDIAEYYEWHKKQGIEAPPIFPHHEFTWMWGIIAIMRSTMILTREALRGEDTRIEVPPQFFLRNPTPWDILSDEDIRSMIFQKRKELEYPIQSEEIWYEWEPFEQFFAARFEMEESEVKEIMAWFWEKKQNDPIRNCIRKLEYELRNRMNPERKNTKEDLERKKAEIQIREVVAHYVQLPNRARPWSLIPCPFPDHQDKTSSFMIYDKTNTCKCFGCHKWWSAIDFIMHFEGCSLRDAIQKFLNF